MRFNDSYGAFGLPIFSIPVPSNGGTFTGDEFRPYASEYAGLQAEVEEFFGVISGIPADDAYAGQLNGLVTGFKTALNSAIAKINKGWDWCPRGSTIFTCISPGGRRADQEKILQDGFKALMGAYRNFVGNVQRVLGQRDVTLYAAPTQPAVSPRMPVSLPVAPTTRPAPHETQYIYQDTSALETKSAKLDIGKIALYAAPAVVGLGLLGVLLTRRKT